MIIQFFAQKDTLMNYDNVYCLLIHLLILMKVGLHLPQNWCVKKLYTHCENDVGVKIIDTADVAIELSTKNCNDRELQTLCPNEQLLLWW